jgi:hypothetical protein
MKKWFRNTFTKFHLQIYFDIWLLTIETVFMDYDPTYRRYMKAYLKFSVCRKDIFRFLLYQNEKDFWNQ